MQEKDITEVNMLFAKFIKTIDLIQKSEFYDNKNVLIEVEKIVEKWYSNFLEKESLTTISVEDLKFIDVEVSDFFDLYIETESVSNNYSERLVYYLGKLKKYWKDEIIKEGDSSVR